MLTGILSAWPMRACSVRGGDIDCMVVDFGSILVKCRRYNKTRLDVADDRSGDGQEKNDFVRTEAMVYVSLKTTCLRYLNASYHQVHVDLTRISSIPRESGDGERQLK